MKISVLIPTYNRAQKLQTSLICLAAQTVAHDQYEIIVIDDGSTDDTKSIVQSVQKQIPTLQLRYQFQENQGQGIARNNGIKKAQGKYILFCQDDIYASAQLLEEHWRTQEASPQPHAVLGKIYWDPKAQVNDVMRWSTNECTFFGKFGGHQFDFVSLDQGNKPTFWHFYTSNISVPRAVLAQDQFNSAFKQYGWEDIELGYRLATKHGLTITYQPKALVRHDHHLELEDVQKRTENIGYNAHLLEKYAPELKVVPRGAKKYVFQIISSWPVITCMKLLSYLRLCLPLYYYCLSKKYFLKGINRVAQKQKTKSPTG